MKEEIFLNRGKVTDVAIIKVKNAINAAFERIDRNERVKIAELLQKIAFLEAENARLKCLIDKKPIAFSYKIRLKK